MRARGWVGTGILVIVLCAGFGAVTGAAASLSPGPAKNATSGQWPDAFRDLAWPQSNRAR
jgi:hypothetical protein